MTHETIPRDWARLLTRWYQITRVTCPHCGREKIERAKADLEELIADVIERVNRLPPPPEYGLLRRGRAGDFSTICTWTGRSVQDAGVMPGDDGDGGDGDWFWHFPYWGLDPDGFRWFPDPISAFVDMVRELERRLGLRIEEVKEV